MIVKDRPFAAFERDTPAVEVIQRVARGGWQDVFPVLSIDGSVAGVITADVLRIVMQDPEISLTVGDDSADLDCATGTPPRQLVEGRPTPASRERRRRR